MGISRRRYPGFNMMHQIDQLYKVEKKDIKRAGALFASAFREDPVWKEVFRKATDDQWNAFFENPVRYCRKFGNIYSPTEKLEGMIGWVHSVYGDMTLWRALRCGSLFSSARVGLSNLKDMMTIFEPLEKARKHHMKDREYLYVLILGIEKEYQGQGYGGKLIRALIEESEEKGIPIYLETSTEDNVAMYEYFKFRKLGSIVHPVIERPQWSLLREP